MKRKCLFFSVSFIPVVGSSFFSSCHFSFFFFVDTIIWFPVSLPFISVYRDHSFKGILYSLSLSSVCLSLTSLFFVCDVLFLLPSKVQVRVSLFISVDDESLSSKLSFIKKEILSLVSVSLDDEKILKRDRYHGIISFILYTVLLFFFSSSAVFVHFLSMSFCINDRVLYTHQSPKMMMMMMKERKKE